MTTKRWNAGVSTVLSVFFSISLATAPAAAGGEVRAGTAGLSRTVDSTGAPAGGHSAAIHRIGRPSGTPNLLEISVEMIGGVLVADGSLPGTIEIILTDTYIPAAMAQRLTAESPLVNLIDFSESAWGRESEAQITVSVADGVFAETRQRDRSVDVVLTSSHAPGERYVLRFIQESFPLQAKTDPGSAATLTDRLRGLASRPVADETRGWWTGARSIDTPGQDAAVTRANLVAVRDAEVKLIPLNEALFAAQDAEPPAEKSAGEPAAPAVEEAQPAPEPPAKREPKAVNSAEANKELTRQILTAESAQPEEMPATPHKKVWTGDPLRQPVSIDFRNTDLVNVVQILANMGNINVIAGTDLVGTVTLNLRDVPLMQAIQTALRINGLGIVEEEGIYHIKPYLDAIAAQRKTDVVDIENADAAEIVTTLKSVIEGSEYESLISLSSNKTANTVIVAGPEEQIRPLVTMAKRLDVEQAVLPTVTMPIKLNYADPADMAKAVEGMLTPEIGRVSVDERARVLVVTDIPIIVTQITDLIDQLDTAVKQVSIDAMIVDVTLTDAADTGVDWIVSAVQSQSRRDAAAGNGIFTGDLQDLSLGSSLNVGDVAGLLNFGILSGDIDWRGVIQAEVRNNNSTLLSNPRLITVENQAATITIASEIPYVELTSTQQGGQLTSTRFKPIGTTLEVTPKVTHDDHIIAKIVAKESTSSQVVNGVPVEDLRQIDTTPHIASGQTIYVGGLRKNNDTVSVRKVPILGDVPIVNFLFRSNQRNERVNELLVFLTCSVVEDKPTLTGYQQEQVDRLRNAEVKVSAETAAIYDAVHPSEFRDPAWKWRENHGKGKMDVQESEPSE